MPLEPRQLRNHVQDLRGRIAFLRALAPDSPTYKLWLGDVIELVNLQWGVDSRQMAQVRAAIGRGGRHPEPETASERTTAYLAKLDDVDVVMQSFERDSGAPITFFE